MPIIRVTSLSEPGLEVYGSLTERQLKSFYDDLGGLFIAESPKVIKVALDAGYEPVSVLCEEKHIEGDAKDIIRRSGDIPVYIGERDLLASLTGYTLTRGVLCAMRRKPTVSIADVCRDAHRVAVINGVVDNTNIGAIFRSAAALGIDGVIVTSDSADPFYRRSSRVAMGTVFQVPWTYVDAKTWQHAGIDLLHQAGYQTAAMALRHNTVSIDDPKLTAVDRLAIIMGSEGPGLKAATIEQSNFTIKIPMAPGVDSLNVAAASALAFWELGDRVAE